MVLSNWVISPLYKQVINQLTNYLLTSMDTLVDIQIFPLGFSVLGTGTFMVGVLGSMGSKIKL